MKYHEDCNGCKLNGYTGYCAFNTASIAEYCPCLLCLVKPICNKEVCQIRSAKYFKNMALSELTKDTIT